MLSNDANILKIKHEILYQVAKLAYAGQLEEKKEELPYELLPGPQAKYRCCLGERHYYPKSSKPQSTTYQPKNHHTPPINIYSPNNQQCPDISLGERQLLSKIFKKPIKNRKVNIHQTPRYHLFSILVSLINKLIPK